MALTLSPTLTKDQFPLRCALHSPSLTHWAWREISWFLQVSPTLHSKGCNFLSIFGLHLFKITDFSMADYVLGSFSSILTFMWSLLSVPSWVHPLPSPNPGRLSSKMAVANPASLPEASGVPEPWRLSAQHASALLLLSWLRGLTSRHAGAPIFLGGSSTPEESPASLPCRAGQWSSVWSFQHLSSDPVPPGSGSAFWASFLHQELAVWVLSLESNWRLRHPSLLGWCSPDLPGFCVSPWERLPSAAVASHPRVSLLPFLRENSSTLSLSLGGLPCSPTSDCLGFRARSLLLTLEAGPPSCRWQRGQPFPLCPKGPHWGSFPRVGISYLRFLFVSFLLSAKYLLLGNHRLLLSTFTCWNVDVVLQ